jgi:hypothetical protein
MASNAGMHAGSPNGGEQWTGAGHSSAGDYSEFSPTLGLNQLYLCICFLITMNRIEYLRPAMNCLSTVALAPLERFDTCDRMAAMPLRNGGSHISEYETGFARLLIWLVTHRGDARDTRSEKT